MSNEDVATRHPLYSEIAPDWEVVEDCAKGERHIKSCGTKYLPATSGMIANGMQVDQPGWKQYQAYLIRAVFPDLVQPAINAMVGVMHREPANIQMPEGMKDIEENATLEGENLQTLLRRINEGQLKFGRIGILVDVPTGQEALPYISVFEATKIINWDESRRPDGRLRPDLVVLDESGDERTSTFGWEHVTKHLVLDLTTPAEANTTLSDSAPVPPQQGSVYRSRLMIDNEASREVEGVNRQTEVTAQTATSVNGVFPAIRGTTMEEIPFVFIGSVDLSAKPDIVPMLGLSRLSLTIYRGEADYRNTLFMQGQDTLVITGDTSTEATKKKNRTVGANNCLDLPTGASAEYIGVSSDGLAEQREALDNDRNRASELGANILSSTKGGNKEAEETLRIRVAARTASVLSIVKAGAEGLETALKLMATWRGLNPDDVKVTPNMDFVGDKFAPSELVELMTAKNMGAPIARESIHKWMQDKDVTALTLEEEIQLIEEEEPIKGEPDPEAEAQAKAEDREFQLQLLNQQTPQGNPEDQGNPEENEDEPGNQPAGTGAGGGRRRPRNRNRNR